MNGLNIDITGFEKLASKQKLTVLYQNTEQLKRMIQNYKFNQKVQYILIASLFIIGGAGKYMGLI